MALLSDVFFKKKTPPEISVKSNPNLRVHDVGVS